MFDIHFYRKAFDLKRQLDEGTVDGETAFRHFEEWRNPDPVVYNIETTNVCNMRCEMCPGPTRMTRPRVTMPLGVFQAVIDQLRAWTPSEWSSWERFVEEKYGIGRGGMGENHFFLHIIPKVLVLHGYGEPLLDRHIVERVRYVADRGIPSYFSCNPWNITVDLGRRLFEAGLDYIKFSTDSPDDFSIQQIRGSKANFSESFKKITRLLEIRKEEGYHTTVVITMLDLNKPNQKEDYQRLVRKFQGQDVYIYLKSQDQLWFEETGARTQSVHWLEPCQFPWSSMTIKSDGSAAQCVEDFNNEIVLGHVPEESLRDIWNGERYRRLREEHLRLRPGIKCTEECDMHLIGEFSCVK